MTENDRHLVARASTLLGSRVSIVSEPSTGYTPALRRIVRSDDGSQAFAKYATDDQTARWLRSEIRFYEQAQADWMPRLLAADDGERPVLVLEDLSHCAWPPPWDTAKIDAVLETLDRVRGVRADVPRFEDEHTLRGWHDVAEDPEPFLSLGMVDREWLDAVLPDLLAARDSVEVHGEDLLHLDVRSDNLCFRDGRAVLVDWNNACTGNADLDVAAWLPSLAFEEGPKPSVILPGRGDLASMICGFFASRAGRPEIPTAPFVRRVQREQLTTALPWVVVELDLPKPKGRNPGPGRST